MGKIPGIEFANVQRDVINPSLASPALAARAAGGILSTAADITGEAADTLLESEVREAKTHATELTSQFLIDEAQAFEQAKVTDQRNPADFTKRYLEKLDSRVKQIGGTDLPPLVRNEIENWYTDYRVSAAKSAISYEASQKSKVQLERLDMAADNLVSLSTQGPQQYAMAKAQLDALYDNVSQSVIVPNPEKTKQDVRKKMAEANAANLIAGGNIAQAKQFLEANREDLGESYVSYKKKAKVYQNSAAEARNEFSVMEDVVDNADLSYEEKVTQIDRLELEETISKGFATKARRYLKSSSSAKASNNDDFKDIITQVYDLNANQDYDDEDYLIGIRNVRMDLAEKRESGEISAKDYESLRKQINTLSSARVAESTTNVAMTMESAHKEVIDTLPPEHRGKGYRELFYKTLDQDLNKEQVKLIANDVVKDINQQRRYTALQTVKSADPKKASASPSVPDFVKSMGYTIRDVEETAKKYNITPAQVIEKLREKNG
jgi:hypothetical protein